MKNIRKFKEQEETKKKKLRRASNRPGKGMMAPVPDINYLYEEDETEYDITYH